MPAANGPSPDPMHDRSQDVMNDMDPRLLDLLQTRITSFVKWDVMRFFHERPQMTDTAENIARYTGRDPRAVEAELIQLARHDIVEMETLAGLRVYTLSDNHATRQLIHEFFTACDDRRFRIKAIYHVIHNLH